MSMLDINVNYGDRFRVGPHLFQCGDLLAPGEWEGFVKSWRRDRKSLATLVYSDPPWNAGNLAYWRTQAGYDYAKQDYGRFVVRFVECASMLEPKVVYIENPIKSPDPLILAAARSNGWPNLSGRWTVRYGAKRGDGTRLPNLLLRFAGYPWSGNPSEMHGQAMVEHVFDREPATADRVAVVDPCVGLGTTVRVAHARGLSCLGNELNRKRLARTIGWLVKQGLEVERL